MITPRPHDRQVSAHGLGDQAVMETVTVGLPRWPIVRLLGRNPLIRISDRVEAVVLVLAVLVSPLAASIAAAVGTAVDDSRRHLYAEQAQIATSSPRRSPTTMPPDNTRKPTLPSCRPDGLRAEPGT